MAAFTCQNFIITRLTLDELIPISYGSKNLVLKKINQLFQNDDILVIDQSNIIDVNEKLKKPEFTSLRKSVEKGYDWNFKKSWVRDNAQIMNNDLYQLAISNIHSIPLLTQDRHLKDIQFKSGKPLSNFNIPFPFSSDSLVDFDLTNIFKLGKPFRKLYRKAFLEIAENSLTVFKLKENLDRKEACITEQQTRLDDLSYEFDRERQRALKWKNLAEPKLGEAIFWTGIETGLSLAQVPVPTTPISYYIQAKRYKKMEQDEKEYFNS